MSLDALKALTQKLKKETGTAAPAGEKKFVTKAELEAARLLKIREEEEQEKKKKDLKRKQQEDINQDENAAKQSKRDKQAAEAELLLPVLSRDEVIRRLRALSQPITLFGEEDVDRLKRLIKAEKEVAVEDENRGGQQGNVLLELQRQERERAKQKAKDLAALKAAAGDAGSSRGREGGKEAEAKQAQGPSVPADAPGGSAQAQEEDETLAAFKKAAVLLAEKRAEEAMCLEDRIGKWLKRWTKEWEADLDKRPDAVKATAVGYQTTYWFEQTKKYLEPLFERLKHKALHVELKSGLWMMVQAMLDRNYQNAYEIYLALAIGNAPWPIGVTSVGIHERSAREKISHVMNSSGTAHIMNDEATRKYLQAMKRLLGAVQRMYPTVPSRSVDFETTTDLGRGATGAGSHKLALLQAEAKGETVESLGLPDAPHFLEEDGKVKVPAKWTHRLAKAQAAEPQPRTDGSPAPASPAPAKSSPAVP